MHIATGNKCSFRPFIPPCWGANLFFSSNFAPFQIRRWNLWQSKSFETYSFLHSGIWAKKCPYFIAAVQPSIASWDDWWTYDGISGETHHYCHFIHCFLFSIFPLEHFFTEILNYSYKPIIWYFLFMSNRSFVGESSVEWMWETLLFLRNRHDFSRENFELTSSQ